MTLKPLLLLTGCSTTLFAAQPAWQDPAVNAVNRAPMQMGPGRVNSWSRLPRGEYLVKYEDRTFTFTLSPVEHAYSKTIQ